MSVQKPTEGEAQGDPPSQRARNGRERWANRGDFTSATTYLKCTSNFKTLVQSQRFISEVNTLYDVVRGRAFCVLTIFAMPPCQNRKSILYYFV